MAIDYRKLSDQLEFLKKWKARGRKGSLVAVTGFGKTTVGTLAIQDLNQLLPGHTCNVIVPTIALKKQWDQVLQKWELKNAEAFVINSYLKTKRTTDLLILDEIHRYGSRTFAEIFNNTNYQFILGLTATLERQDGNHSLLSFYAPVLRTIGLNEALSRQYVSDFSVFNLAVELDSDERKSYDEISLRFEGLFTIFGNNFHTAMACLKSRSFREQYSQRIGKSGIEVLHHAIGLVKVIQDRKTLLNESCAKLRAVKDIFLRLSYRMIIFSETTEFADRIADALGSGCFPYHTASDKKLMNQRLQQFKDGAGGKAVSAVKSLDEGIDIPDLEMAVLVGGNSTRRQYIQRIGRSLRVRPNKQAIIINLYVNGTKDEKWLRARQFANEINVSWVSDVSQIEDQLAQNKDTLFEEKEPDIQTYESFSPKDNDFEAFRCRGSGV